MRQTLAFANNLNAIERLLEYRDLPPEGAPSGGGAGAEGAGALLRGVEVEADPPPGWPSSGRLEFRGVVARYPAAAEPALRGLSLAAPPGLRTCVCGRTGAGKSTLTLVALRALAPEAGSVLLDGVDVSRVPRATLRRLVSLVPQEAVLFSGTVRDSLDPLRRHTEAECEAALEAVGVPGCASVRDQVDAGGAGLSVGQRQLLALARALLGRARLVLLDEATAHVDARTNERMQAVLRRHFEASTVVMVAHRIADALAADRVVVLDRGVNCEEGSPEELVARGASQSAFARLVAADQGGGPAAEAAGDEERSIVSSSSTVAPPAAEGIGGGVASPAAAVGGKAAEPLIFL